MIKYLKYYISTLTLILAIYLITQGSYYPTFFFIGFSLFIILGDYLIQEDDIKDSYSFPVMLNLPIYINFIFLFIFIIISSSFFSEKESIWFLYLIENVFQVDNLFPFTPIHFIDKISLIFLLSLFIGIIGTVPGHELIHRKKNKFDLFIGNWLLAFSWDCSFAVEHVQGHHKNVGLPKDPATAKRDENIYKFILKAILQEHKDSWSFELKEMKKKKYGYLSFRNRIIIGYARSLIITMTIFFSGGAMSTLFYLICALLAKAFLEVINYTEHYGLVREPGKAVGVRHSWNSNSKLSSLYLFNVTRHSSHHEKASLKFWELDPQKNGPRMPFGYLSMLYLALFLPNTFHKVMREKIDHWDNNFATNGEKEIINKLYIK